MKTSKLPCCLALLIAIAFLIAALSIRMPGTVLTSYDSMNGKTASGYSYGNQYVTIDEYVGGDCYNLIIGATLVAGDRTAAQISKTVCFAASGICLCFSLLLYMMGLKRRSENTLPSPADAPVSSPVIPEKTREETTPPAPSLQVQEEPRPETEASQPQ